MTNKYLHKLTGVVLILTGVMLFFFAGESAGKVLTSIWFHLLLIFYCITQYYFASVKKNHIKIYLSVFFFLIGVVLFSTSNFEILKLDKLLILSSYIIPGISFLFLFTSDTKEKIFLYLTSGWIVLGGIVFYFLPDYILLLLITNVISVFLTTLPLLAISIGILNLLKK